MSTEAGWHVSNNSTTDSRWVRLTGEAGGPGDVQVEVLGSIDEHVQVPVGLKDAEKTQAL